MRTCPRCGNENPDENGYCEQCHELLPAEILDADDVPPTYHPYVMWQGWPWAPNRTVMQSKEEFTVAIVAGTTAIAVAAGALAFSFAVVFGGVWGTITGVVAGGLGIAYLYALWKSGRELALGYEGANP